jgi:hypothetical protein
MTLAPLPRMRMASGITQRASLRERRYRDAPRWAAADPMPMKARRYPEGP